MTRDLKFGTKSAQSGRATSMVVFLHGFGADGADLLGLADPLGPHLPGTIFHAPDAPEPCAGNPFGRQWFPIPWHDGSSQEAARVGLLRSAEDLDAFLDARLDEAGLTPDRLAVVGFSQGSMLALHVLPRRAEPVAGIVAFSGRLIAPESLPGQLRSRPPVLLIHGDADQMVPFAEMEAAGHALLAAGFETFGHVMKGTGHGIAPDGLSVALTFLRERLHGA